MTGETCAAGHGRGAPDTGIAWPHRHADALTVGFEGERGMHRMAVGESEAPPVGSQDCSRAPPCCRRVCTATEAAGATGRGPWRGRRAVGLADGHFPFALAPMVTVLRGVGQEGGDIEKRCYFSVLPHRRGCRRPLPGCVSPTPAMARAELVYGSQLCGKTETRGWIMKVIGKGCLL